MLSVAYK